MKVQNSIPFLLLLTSVITNLVNCDNDDEETTSIVSTISSSSSTSNSTGAPKHLPLKAPDCFWTECKSPLTYTYKCPPETQEQNQNDDGPCEGIFISYQCCPKEKQTKPDKDNDVLKPDTDDTTQVPPVVPQAI